MIRMYDLSEMNIADILERDFVRPGGEEVERIVADILDDVRKNGDSALFSYTEKLDGVKLTFLEVSEEEIRQAVSKIDPVFLETLALAKGNIEHFHKQQIRSNFILNDREGVLLGQKVSPIERVGLYVPGGTASYPSSVLMSAVPAKLAGVKELVMVTPPNKQGGVPAEILAAAKLAGVDRIFKLGGAQAIAALAYGTKSVPRVYKIVGPGNIFVATAKRRVFGLVDIDMVAGPSEILIIADKTANPVTVAADLLSQAEHDALATAVLITDSPILAKSVSAELEKQMPLLPRNEICRASIDNNGKIIVARDIGQAIEAANAIAPEHLELCIADPFAALNQVKNAGSIFLGKYAPEALGDYLAGPNHILPTGGTARFSSPLSVDDFVKKSSFIYYTKEALAAVKDRVVSFAEAEGLNAHGRSVMIRFDGEEEEK